MQIIRAKSREEWLEQREGLNRIGGSECAAVLGMNPWTTNVQLWQIKTGRAKKPKVTSEEAVNYGRQAEEHIRELFKLDFPEFGVWHEPDAIILNDAMPWALASVDGLLTTEDGRLGVLEIKTAELRGAATRKKWDGKIPDNYYCQILHYMAVTGATFAVLTAQLSQGTGENLTKITRHYWIEREDAEEDIEALMAAERLFWRHVEDDTEPALILPTI